MLHSAIDAQALIDLKILIVIAFCLLASPFLAKFLRLPLSATEILLGALFGLFGLIGESVNFKLLANVGFYYLMFIAGMEVNLKRFFEMKRSFLRRALIYIALLYAVSALMVSLYDSTYIFVIILPVMSVGLLSILFKDFGRDCEWLNVSMIVATLAEIVSIVLLTIVGAFLKEDATLWQLVQNLCYLFLFLLLCVLGFKTLKIIFWWYPQLKVILMPWQDRSEKDIRFSMAIFIFIIVIMIVTELEIALGAFVAGAFLATFFDHKKDLEHRLSSFGYGFLIPVFFIYIGSTFDVRKLTNIYILESSCVLLIAMIGLRVLCAGVFIKKLGLKNTLLFALSHSMPLTLLIATATLSLEAKLITSDIYATLILTALLEAIIVMSLIKFIAHFKGFKTSPA